MIQKRLMPPVIFREYDIRGKVETEFFIDQMYDVGRALAYFFKQRNPHIKTIAIGMDGRIHSPQIKDELVKAMQDSGIDVLFIGLCHSPALYFATHTLPVDAGLMVTASHNPKEYNGIKINLGIQSIWGSDIKELYTLYKDGKRIDAPVRGSYAEHDILPSYVDWLVEHFKHLKDMKLSAVIDCGNGAGGTVIPSLIDKMGWQNVLVLYPEVDGTYPHHEADPVKLENMQDVKRVMQQGNVAVGIGLDGDADRMAPMTKKGRLVSGDLLLGLFAQDVIKHHPGAAIVFDIKSSAALLDYATQLGAQPITSPSGHSIVKQEMQQHNALLGGELSCHFFFNDRYFGYDDGVYAMLRLFELLEDGQDLDELLAVYPSMHTSPEFRIACNEDKKQLIVQTVTDIFAQKDNAQLVTIDGVRATMPYGWGLLRASNTQPVLSLRFESHTQDGLGRIKEDFIKALAPFYDEAYLKQEFCQS